MRQLSFFIIAIALITGCADLNKQSQLTAIDQMQTTLDSLEKVVKANEIDTIAALRVATNTLELRIKNYYDSDTINIELGKKMNAFKSMRRRLNPLGRSYSTLNRGIIEQRKQLKNLKTDIEQGNGKRNEYNTYIAHEKGKIIQLKSILTAYIKEKDSTMSTFHKLYPELNAFSLEQMEKYNRKRNRNLN